MGWCHIQSVSPPHVYNFVRRSKAPVSAPRSFIVKFNHGKKESRKKTGLSKLRASTAQAAEVFDSVARVRDGDEHAGEVLDGFSVGGDSSDEEEVEVGGLELFYDDGYGSSSVRDYLDIAKEMVRPDGGPPRWFCPIECERPIKGAPVLLFLPGIGPHSYSYVLA